MAAVFENESLTYAELNDKANVVAARLLQEKQEGETIVGLLLGRNLNLLVGILGVVKAGCTYLPIDPDRLRNGFDIRWRTVRLICC